MDRGELRQLYRRVRGATRALAEPLTAEDQMVQSMPDASPTKWHLAHTTWFFETFVLARAVGDHVRVDPRWAILFNSYYDGVGAQFERARRGQLSRPGLDEVLAWRERVDAAVDRLLESATDRDLEQHLFTIELGINHEEQHQELILTDIKHALFQSTLDTAYSPERAQSGSSSRLEWRTFEGGLRWVGHAGATFAFDNERPRHRVHLEPFSLGNRLVTAGEWVEFILDGGYRTKSLWLSQGWEEKQAQGWDAPLYWRADGGAGWTLYTLSGRRKLDPHEPVCHVSLYEADAFATWAGARLPSEHELEVAANELGARPRDGNFVESGAFHPRAARPAGDRVEQLLGDAWEWTGSAYRPYPGFSPFEGALGEYNGKFMMSQMVLRGGSCLSPTRHLRPSYRNFFPPSARWQMTGVRLARSV